MARADQDRQYLERWLEDAERRNDGSLYLLLPLARGALASRSASRVYSALITCLAADRHAVEQTQRKIEDGRRHVGGRNNGARLTAKAQREWAPRVAQYRALIASGKKPADARRLVAETIQEVVADRTLRKWLPTK
jgi:hypothetical protein